MPSHTILEKLKNVLGTQNIQEVFPNLSIALGDLAEQVGQGRMETSSPNLAQQPPNSLTRFTNIPGQPVIRANEQGRRSVPISQQQGFRQALKRERLRTPQISEQPQAKVLRNDEALRKFFNLEK